MKERYNLFLRRNNFHRKSRCGRGTNLKCGKKQKESNSFIKIEEERIKMPEDEKWYSKQVLGKVVVTKSGKRFGEVSNLTFETRTGELIHVILRNPTVYTGGLDLEKDPEGNLMIPFSAVVAIGDFVVVSEEDIM